MLLAFIAIEISAIYSTSSVENSLKRNIHSFWSYVKNLNNDSSIASKTFLGSTHATNESLTSNLFSTIFSSTYSDSVLEEVPPDQSCDKTISQIEVSAESLRCLVYNLKDSASSGPDNIPAYCYTRTHIQ